MDSLAVGGAVEKSGAESVGGEDEDAFIVVVEVGEEILRRYCVGVDGGSFCDPGFGDFGGGGGELADFFEVEVGAGGRRGAFGFGGWGVPMVPRRRGFSVFGDPDAASELFVKIFDGGRTAGVKTEAGGGAVEDDAKVFGAGVFSVGGDAGTLGESTLGG